ncbi:MAG: tetratricopeptide repeat protein [Armatimonadetes bacterium]|nr:tetratricopeptide repeat protein [Armatimonadota bacterium]
MFCPHCKKGFPDALRMCPECFGDLEVGSSEPITAAPPGSWSDVTEEETAPGPAAALEVVPRAGCMPVPPPKLVAAVPSSTSAPALAGLAGVFCLLLLGLFLFGLRGPTEASPQAGDRHMNTAEADGWLSEAHQRYASKDFVGTARLAENALKRYQEVGSSSQEVEARELLALSYYQVQDYAKSLTHYRALAEARPENAEYREALQQVEGSLKAHRRLQANQKLEQAAAELDKGDAAVAADLAGAALDLYQKNGGDEASLAAAYTIIGRSYAEEGVHEQAVIYLRQALAVQPGYRDAEVALRGLESRLGAATKTVAVSSSPPVGASAPTARRAPARRSATPLRQNVYPKARPRTPPAFPYPVDPGDPLVVYPAAPPVAPPVAAPHPPEPGPPPPGQRPVLPQVSVPRPSSYTTYNGYDSDDRPPSYSDVLPSYQKPSQGSLPTYKSSKTGVLPTYSNSSSPSGLPGY